MSHGAVLVALAVTVLVIDPVEHGLRGAELAATASPTDARQAGTSQLYPLPKPRAASHAVRFRRFERSLRAGSVLEVLVSRSEAVGKFTRFRIRPHSLPVREDLCLRPGETVGSPCPNV